MKIKTRLSLFCSLTFGVVFAVISVLIYGLYYKNTSKAIYKNLEKTAHISALFYLEEDELNAKEFDKIRKQFEEIVSDSSYTVFDSSNRIVYGFRTLEISVSVMERIRQNDSLIFSTEDYLCYGIFYTDNQGDFVVIAKENKTTLKTQVNMLLWILIPLFLTGVIAIVVLSRWVANIAYNPFSEAIKEVNNISVNNLNVQINSPKTNDELQDLIDTFNSLLAKISETVVIQKNFVRFVSHEFKTPLTSMLGNLDLFSLKNRTPQEYHQLSEKLMQQIFQLEETIDTLIIISDLRKDGANETNTRIDELVWEIIDKMKHLYPSSKILVNMDVDPADEEYLVVSMNRTQLLIALLNIVENALKYSRKENVEIHLFKTGQTLCVSVTDKGIGIPETQLACISKPFYRADNADEIHGSGIGLSLALRIFDKNGVSCRIESTIGVGTKVTVRFKF